MKTTLAPDRVKINLIKLVTNNIAALKKGGFILKPEQYEADVKEWADKHVIQQLKNLYLGSKLVIAFIENILENLKSMPIINSQDNMFIVDSGFQSRAAWVAYQAIKNFAFPSEKAQKVNKLSTNPSL